MKNFLLLALLVLTFHKSANAMEGSWFGVSTGYENLSSGFSEEGLSLGAEGGYWYLGNVAYGGYFKANFFGEANNVRNTNLKILDLGAFWKAGTEQGLYGKLLAGLSFVNLDGTVSGFKLGEGKSFYVGLGGGFLFPVSETFQIGPEVVYRHLTAGNGGDQISISALVTYGF